VLPCNICNFLSQNTNYSIVELFWLFITLVVQQWQTEFTRLYHSSTAIVCWLCWLCHALAVVIGSCSITGSLPTDSDSVSDGDASAESLTSFVSAATGVGFSCSFCHYNRHGQAYVLDNKAILDSRLCSGAQLMSTFICNVQQDIVEINAAVSEVTYEYTRHHRAHYVKKWQNTQTWRTQHISMLAEN